MALVELGVVEPALGVAQFGYLALIIFFGDLNDLNDKTDVEVMIAEFSSIRLIAEYVFILE